jgi:glycerol-3-phosphate dehydrogenase (NAD(P)+)
MTIHRIAVIGAGAWGTALANAAARAGRTVTLYARDSVLAAAITATRENPRLPGSQIDESVVITADLRRAAQSDALLLAVPAQSLRVAASMMAPVLPARRPVIICAKGIERGTGKFMTEVLAEALPQAEPAVLSGPSFASDVVRGLPTAVTLAAINETQASALAHALGSASFRPYSSTDMRGAEIGGAAKNVLAIAAGIVHGRGLGASAAAALTTRGFAELFRFGRAFGARPETLTGLSGLGDLILTCSSAQSRNFSLGVRLGQGADPRTAPGSALAEGAFTASILVQLAQNRDVEMPIAAAVSGVLESRMKIGEAITSLLNRPFRAEH